MDGGRAMWFGCGAVGAGAVAGGEGGVDEEEEGEWLRWEEPKTPWDLRPRSRSSQVMSSATKPMSVKV